MRYRILPYRQGSRSALELAKALEGKVLLLEGSRFVREPDDVVINWGNTNPPEGLCNLNSNSEGLRNATNKLLFFRTLRGRELTPVYWERSNDISDDAFPVLCRTVLAGHSGDGIVIADTRAELRDCSLFVKYIKKESEFRIHVGKRQQRSIIISEQKKVARQGVEPTDWRIRNLANGFVFQRQGISVPDCVRDAAVQTLDSLQGIDFGAVDVIYNKRHDTAFVLEVNTAPGLEGQTIQDYANFFRSL